MKFFQNYQYRKTIAILLVVTILSLLIFPVQIHLHHEQGTHGYHEHVIDYHMVLDDIDNIEHIKYGDAHVIETSSDFITKQALDNPFKFVALLVLFLIMPLQAFTYYQHHYHPIRLNYQKYYSFSPPLRAPPL